MWGQSVGRWGCRERIHPVPLSASCLLSLMSVWGARGGQKLVQQPCLCQGTCGHSHSHSCIHSFIDVYWTPTMCQELCQALSIRGWTQSLTHRAPMGEWKWHKSWVTQTLVHIPVLSFARIFRKPGFPGCGTGMVTIPIPCKDSHR